MASWLGLMEREREVDRMIGTAVYLRAKAEGHSDGSALVALKEKANDGAIKAAVLMMRTQMGSERSYQCGREAAFKDVIRWISEAGTQKQEGAQ